MSRRITLAALINSYLNIADTDCSLVRWHSVLLNDELLEMFSYALCAVALVAWHKTMRNIYLDSISCEEQAVFILRHLYVCDSGRKEFADNSLILVMLLQIIFHWVLHEMSINNLEVLATII